MLVLSAGAAIIRLIDLHSRARRWGRGMPT